MGYDLHFFQVSELLVFKGHAMSKGPDDIMVMPMVGEFLAYLQLQITNCVQL